MQEAAVAQLAAWQNFYVVVGSASAAMTGLMFVVVTLVANTGRRGASEGVGAFGTQNVLHFCAALLVAAIFSAPWPALWNAGLLLGLCGLGGVTYIMIVVRRMRRQRAYQPVLVDWLWFVVFPFISYLALFVAAIVLTSNPTPALFVTGAATVFLVFIGIYNAWDTVTYLTLSHSEQENKGREQSLGSGDRSLD